MKVKPDCQSEDNRVLLFRVRPMPRPCLCVRSVVVSERSIEAALGYSHQEPSDEE